MNSILIIVAVVIAILLVISVLVQNPKGGGVASGWGINTNQFGVRKTTDFLEKSTWVLVSLLLIISVTINIYDVDAVEESNTPSSVNVEKAQENKSPMPTTAPAPAAKSGDAVAPVPAAETEE